MRISKENLIMLIYEQIENADAETMKDVNTMIDYLDFPVSAQNLKDAYTMLQKYANNGKIKIFLELYQKSGLGSGDLGKSLRYITAFREETVVARERLRNLYNKIISGISSNGTEPSKTGNTETQTDNLSGIETTWNGNNVTPTPVPPKPPKPAKIKYKDCTDKTENIEFGCISPVVKKLQRCLGIHPYNDETKAPTGHFGNITKRKLKVIFPNQNVDVLTKEMIDKIEKDYCARGSGENGRITAQDVNPQLFPQNTPQKIYNPEEPVKIPTSIKPTSLPISTELTPEQFYNGLRSTGAIIGEDGARRIKYKGPELNEKQIGDLDMVLDKLGYDRIKALEDRKRYGSKYVWLKRKTVKA